MRENAAIAGLVVCFPVIGEIPTCSDILVCKCMARGLIHIRCGMLQNPAPQSRYRRVRHQSFSELSKGELLHPARVLTNQIAYI